MQIVMSREDWIDSLRVCW